MNATIALPELCAGPEAQAPKVSSLRADIHLYAGTPGASGEPTWTLHDPLRNAFFSLGWLEYELLLRWGYSDPEIIAQQTRATTTLEATAEDVLMLDGFLKRNELVTGGTQEQIASFMERVTRHKPGLTSFLLHRYLFFRIPLLHPDAFLEGTLPLVRPFFGKTFQRLLLFSLLLALFLAVRQWGTFVTSFEMFASLSGIACFAIALVFSKCMHELGHAYTCKRYGLKVPSMGVAFLVMWPFLYTDTTESWKLASRRQRLFIGLAGMYVELVLAVFATLLWTFLADGALRNAVFFLATASWLMTLAINLNPFMRWDGYYILSDLLGVQNLQPRSFALAKWHLRELLFGFGEAPTENQRPAIHRTMIAYAYCTWLYRFVLFLGIALLVYFFFFKALGLLLMAVELVWFIGRPVYLEITEWYERRQAMRWNRYSISALLLLFAVAGLLLVPWKQHVSSPAIMQPALHKTFHSPVAAQLVAAHVVPGQSVTKGQLLFEFRSPELEYHFRNSRNQIELSKASLARHGRRDLLEQREVELERLAEAMSTYRGYRKQLKQLTVTAPFDGEIVMVADNLTPGQWISEQLPVATLVDKESIEVSAYASEDDLDRILPSDPATFYPEDPTSRATRLRVVELDRSSTRSLRNSALASTNGGPIPARESSPGDSEAVPTEAIYRIRLHIDDELFSSTDTVARGTVHFPTPSESLISRTWSKIQGVLIRESSF